MRAFFVLVPAFIIGMIAFCAGVFVGGFSDRQAMHLAGLLFALFTGIGLSATKARPERGEGRAKTPATEGEA